ncbi:DNA repair ATPase [Lewinella cohaerens]|uniref:DNA repair ATPase n=1 Tax=Lewinella cohaerens TaxID=70995 RepID=UPI0003825AA2|nr:DNA repair ATPase [Lewinella cohaerens]
MSNTQNIALDTGTYDIIRGRLEQQADALRQRLAQLNEERKTVFGAIETTLVANDRIHTSNYCTARDVVAIGDHCIFGYNVHVGLRSGIKLSDVFSGYRFTEQSFKEEELSILKDEKFLTDFQNLYRYYKDAFFARFSRRGQYLYMVFHLNEGTTDFKTFKWLVTDEGLRYVDNRSDHEVKFPEQYEFRWRLATRDDQRQGKHPHVSIMDRVFVETVGGDLTIKVEDNTSDGRGIYAEPVEYPDQTLDDAEFSYADLGNLIALRIRPYQEEDRYFVFNEKIQKVERVDALAKSGILLPESQGLIFANGYYLQTGEHKLFEQVTQGLVFKKRISSGNGEDYLFVFYDNLHGTYVLLPYNIISQSITTPIICNGFTLFPGGELCYFKAEEEATKHHVMQIWQTPFVADVQAKTGNQDSFLFKVGNKDIVRAMAECQEVLTLCGKEDSYANLYDDLSKRVTDVLDAYYWIDDPKVFQLAEGLRPIRETAQAAIEEFEKKVRTQRQTNNELEAVAKRAEKLFDRIRRERFDSIELFVEQLAALRQLRGDILGLKELPFTNEELIVELQAEAQKNNEKLAETCVEFLLLPEALQPYEAQIIEQASLVGDLKTAKAASELEESFDEIGGQLELLVEMVSNLKIADATQTTRIIDTISALFTQLNQHKAAIKKRAQQFRTQESAAEFGAQLKLLDQSLINYLDLADTPARCDEFLTKLMVQLEELDSKFAEVEAFTLELTEKREEVYAALENRKNSLVEARNNRTTALAKAAERIFTGVQKRTEAFKELADINSFFAADLMVDKVRDIIQQLYALDDSNKADRIQTQLKSLQEDAVRGLRDRQELFVGGENVIKLGRHRFSVNSQPLELTVVNEGDELLYHLTGTNFYLPIEDEVLNGNKTYWQQRLISEDKQVYRGEYLAFSLLPTALKEGWGAEYEVILPKIQEAAAGRYQEGYTKGIHDEDAARILSTLLGMQSTIGLLAFTPSERALALVWWMQFAQNDRKAELEQQLESAGTILKVFPSTKEFAYLKEDLVTELEQFLTAHKLFPTYLTKRAAAYLFSELTNGGSISVSQTAGQLWEDLQAFLKKEKSLTKFKESLKLLSSHPREQFLLARKWAHAYLEMQNQEELWAYQEELAGLMLYGELLTTTLVDAPLLVQVAEMRGDHALIVDGGYTLAYHTFMDKMEAYVNTSVPGFVAFTQRKRALAESFREDMQLEEFEPKVLSSFVRNRLIDQVYLPIFGDNLAKQIGAVGEQTRTDRMGLLLLISPPGYGKTTLMEYIANRLGLIFVKVNGPAIGHNVVSLAPKDAPSMGAAKELEKLNLALEMGDNIMLYIDDIQHCNPEFLQKFISLCDAQRKIEGVYQGRSKTYDLRGRRVAVVMAGNPYTESGDRFQIPDMLANRADIYNLGDIIGDSAKAFKLSYLENSLTSNPTLAPLAMKARKDLYTMIEGVETARLEDLQLEGSYSGEELKSYINVLTKLLYVRDVVLRVNKAYIHSAGMSDAYRTEPAFKLQGSYRNMNKLAEKVSPIMNDKELNTLLLAHYEGEVQTLTSDAEGNLLKLKELLGLQTKKEAARWEEIKQTFNKNKLFASEDGTDRMAQILAQLDDFNSGLRGIKQALNGDAK